MKELINQAFSHIREISPHVREGRYDLEGPEGELILKEIWNTTIQPGWQITMKMWPNLEQYPPPGAPGLGGMGFGGMRMPPGMAPMRGHGPRAQPPPMGTRMPPVVGGVPTRMPMPPPGFTMYGGGRGAPAAAPAGVEVLNVERKPHKKSSSKATKVALGWLTGATAGSANKKR